jgi:hypothetical protein
MRVTKMLRAVIYTTFTHFKNNIVRRARVHQQRRDSILDLSRVFSPAYINVYVGDRTMIQRAGLILSKEFPQWRSRFGLALGYARASRTVSLLVQR